MLAEVNQGSVVGSTLDGRYRIIKMLGHGGMGNVYLAEETRLRRRCAIKVLHPQLAQDRTHVERFLREAQTIAQLEHPNIVDIYAYGEEPNGAVWFAMELLTGEDLDARLRARPERPFSTHECCAWGVQIARAVGVVHQAGLIHRDLKTSNVFLAQRRDGEEMVKLLDFGIARPEVGSELTATGVALGTPSYMSPEQVRNTVVDRRSDIYSFGVLLFKLLTDRLPFQGDSIQVAMAHCLSPVPVPSAVATETDISPELDAVLLRAMAKEPGDRYQTMAEVEAALTAILHDEAPELAPQARSARGVTHSQLARRSDADGRPTAPAALRVPTLAADAGTASTGNTTGPTVELSVGRQAGGSRWLYFTAGASLVAIALLLAVVMAGGSDDADTQVAHPNVPAATPGAGPLAEVSGVPTTAHILGPSPTPTTPATSATPTVLPAVEPEPPAVIATAPEVPPAAKVSPAPTAVERAADAIAADRQKPKPKPAAAPIDPFKQIEREAQSCRRKHKLVDGPKITVDYATGMDGKVTRAIPSVRDALGDCLAGVVLATQFEPKVQLGRKISL